MATNYKQPGNSINLTAPSGGVTSGNGYVIGNTFVISAVTAAVGASFAGSPVGVYELTKDSGDTGAEGADVYWDNTNKKVEFASATGLFKIGTLTEAATSGKTTAIVRLNGVGVTAAA